MRPQFERPVPSYRRISGVVRRGFVTGLILIAPLAITAFVIRILYNWLVGSLTPFLSLAMSDVSTVGQLLALFSLFWLLTILGIVFRHGFGHVVVKEIDEAAQAIPVVRTIYTSVRQASNALVGQEDRFDRVALVEWPRPGYHTVGFVTDEAPQKVTDHLDDEKRYNVYVPMTPNPTGGFLTIVPESKLVMTDMEVSEGLNIAITTGVEGDDEISPEDLVPESDDGQDSDRDPAPGGSAA